jgi:outer membrane protein assembly factor BamB
VVRIRKLSAGKIAFSAVCVAVASAAFLATGATPGSARPAAGHATVKDISDFGSYVCDQPGFVGFENLSTGTALTSGTVHGLSFSTNNAARWHVGDFAAGEHDGQKYPAGRYTSEQTHFADADGATTATITLTGGLASTFSVLVSDYSNARLEAFAQNGASLGKTPPHRVPDGRHMGQLQIVQPTRKIARVTLTVNGADFAIDSICTDAVAVPTPQLTLTSTDGAPTSATTVEGTGFGAHEKVTIKLNNSLLNGYAMTDASGSFHRNLTIVESAPPGAATIVATGKNSNRTGAANFFVRQNWPQIGFGPGRTAFNPTENQIEPANAASLQPAWGPDGGATGGRPTAVAVVNGVVYTASADGAVYAFNDESGALLWSCVPGTSPCVVGGHQRARHAAKPVALRGAPSYSDGRLFVAAADGNVYALDPANGEALWQFPTGRELNRAPLVAKGNVYVGSDNGSVYALDQESGTQLWKRTLGTPVHSTIATDGNLLYVGTDSGVLNALHIADGTTAWTGTTGLPIRSSPAVTKGAVYVGSGDGNVYAWRASDGEPLWTQPTNQPVGAPVAVGDDNVYVGDESGQLLELSASSGNILNAYPTGSSITSRAAIANNVVYVGSSSDRLYALDLNTNLLTSFPVGSSPTEVTVANGAVYIGSNDNHVDKFVLP